MHLVLLPEALLSDTLVVQGPPVLRPSLVPPLADPYTALIQTRSRMVRPLHGTREGKEGSDVDDQKQNRGVGSYPRRASVEPLLAPRLIRCVGRSFRTTPATRLDLAPWRAESLARPTPRTEEEIS